MFVPLFQALVNGDVNTYLIKGLSPSAEYEVLLAAIYGNEVESDEVILVESTGKITGVVRSLFYPSDYFNDIIFYLILS